ncbi:hypothetical protein M0R04_10090 [Candidatus Dojkabacteria bacterium]|jgi:hypothetical protein|nr:hypothetical protein [Candidatus Dojkabacteria bacterium]
MKIILNFLIKRTILDMRMKGTVGKHKVYCDNLWEQAGYLAEYFTEKDSGEWESLREKLYFRLMPIIQEVFSSPQK